MTYLLTNPQIAVLRDNHPHASRFYLSVLKPTQVYCGVISGSPVKGARTLTLIDESGDITDLEEGITLYVGTSEGDKSISKRRYRSRALQVITVDENAVTWAAGQYVTAYKNWELWPVYPYILPTKPYTFYKDRDITYASVLGNDHIPPVAIAGGPYVGFLDGVDITFNLDGSKSYPMAVGAIITDYLWECDGGVITDDDVDITTIKFTVAGQYWLSLKVSDDNGKSQTIHTPIFVHARSGADYPVVDFAIASDLQGDWSSGGYDIGIELWNETVINDIIEGSYCVLWKESYYAGVEQYMGVNGNIQFVGYVQEESITRVPNAGTVSFTLHTINGILDSKKMPSVSLEESNAAATWYRFPKGTLTVARAIHHLWRWHSTLFSVADVFLPITLTDTMTACDDFENGTLYSMVDTFAYQYSVFAKVCCDIAGRVHVEQDINMLSTVARGLKDVIMNIKAIDRRADTDVAFTRNTQKSACIVASGTYLDGATYKPLISACPGGLYYDMGIDTTTVERLVLHDQAHLNFITGRLFSILNQDVLEVNMQLAGDYPIDLMPQAWWLMEDMDTKRSEIDLEDINAVPRHITFKIDLMSGVVYPEITFEPEAPDLLGNGVTITPPKDPSIYVPPDPHIPSPPPPLSFPDPGVPISFTTSSRFGWSFIIGNGNDLLAPGIVGMIEVPYYCIIDSVIVMSQPWVAGDIEFDLLNCAYIDVVDPVHPAITDSIIGLGAKPTLVADIKSVTVLVGWTTALNKGSWLFVNINSVSGLYLVTLAISGLVYQ